MDRLIFHVDVNSAFLSWEAAYRLHHLGAKTDLREIPSAIGGDMAARHGIILAKSIPAKKFGIQTGQTIPEALRLCPDLYLAPPNYGLYEQCSQALMNLLHEYSSCVEQYSIDEAFLDMSDMRRLYPDPILLANQIRERIRTELGFTVNIGISVNKLLAKMASDFKKPDRVHTLFPDEIAKKMWPLPVSELFFIGHATAAKLFQLGIHTIGELAGTDVRILRSALKKQGEVVWAFSHGMDASPVVDTPPANKGYGNSTTVASDITDIPGANQVLLALCETVCTRLRAAKVSAEVLSVGIKSFDLRYHSHQMVLPAPTNITTELYHYACRLFQESWDGTPIRHLGVYTSRLQEQGAARQLSLFDTMNYDKWAQLDQAIDSIRGRFGIDSVKRAAFIESPVDHLSGGISREKRTVDYSKISLEPPGRKE